MVNTIKIVLVDSLGCEMDIDIKNRLDHMLAVAENMRNIARVNNKDEDYINDMYLLGFLHDIGRFFDNNNHEYVGAEMLKDYRYSNEIRYHGKLSEYHSEELDMLYLADMISSPYGETITIEQRLKDIKNRYGKDSNVLRNSIDIARYLEDVFDIKQLRRKSYNERRAEEI